MGRPPNIPPNTKPTPTHQSKQTTPICSDSESLCGWRPCRGHVQPMAVALGGEETREYAVKSSASVHFIAIYSVPGTRL